MVAWIVNFQMEGFPDSSNVIFRIISLDHYFGRFLTIYFFDNFLVNILDAL